MKAESAVGLDLSLTSTGWATHRETGTITTKSKGMGRLLLIHDQIVEILSDIETPVVAIEGYAFAKQTSHAHAQGELGGIIRMMLFKSKIPWVEIPPTNRAKFATGRGNAGKSEVISQVSAKTGIIWNGSGADDECDAWILREMLLAKFNVSEYEWPSANLDALSRVDWSQLEFA